ncbi:MAG: 23S rRNA (adenine(2503)-C(2))-methyltransferase RlmN [Bacteroides sp.]|nr:23S rRNA (adenine(2503)-C(2))-methyltransferase RlmN [Prevotella sp.]MCM1408208.1 23S rRNA (adenine(2503)-C(2))-methyltransferase RlmN [Treponema brennaborense]MCM1469532.1 23S rRNA (adenine(2503)-C(2))-methyltransferase RlmN [Bacteroides sp.]
MDKNAGSYIFLSGLLPQEITNELHLKETYRGRQIFKWIADGAVSFSQMTNLSCSLRTQLAETALIRSASVSQTLKDPDGTIKLQIKLHDGLCVETVLLIDGTGRKTACVSCQVGCAMKCAFCMTGTLGFARNLSAGEIVEQFLYLEHAAGKLDNIVFMGMGEPLLNLAEIRKAVTILTHPDGRALSSRRITISTAGIIEGIYDLADNGPSVRLAVSLTAAEQKLREQLMPSAKANPLPELKKAIKYFIQKTRKRCTLEAALLGNINTDKTSMDAMYSFAKDTAAHINIIPWNPVKQLPFTEPSASECAAYIENLRSRGINITMRTKRGRKIGGACGQLGSTKT